MGILVRQVVFTAPDTDTAGALLHAGPATGVVCDPGPVGLWNLESILSGRLHADIVAKQPEPVALFNNGQRVVLALDSAFRDQLASARGWRAARAARSWARTDEVRAERLTRADTHKLLRHLHMQASDAVRKEDDLYLWIDVDERALF